MSSRVAQKEPAFRKLKGYAFDPSLSLNLDTFEINKIEYSVPWEKLKPGPSGEYLEVIDYDPTATTDVGCGIPVVVDMGAYEYQGDPVPVKYGDIDGDGHVGIMEFLFVIGSWGPCQADCCMADFDLDGDVGLADFCTVIENWG